MANRLSGLTVESQTHASKIIYNAASHSMQLKVALEQIRLPKITATMRSQACWLDSQSLVRGASTTLLNLSYDYGGSNGKRTGQLTKITNNLDSTKNRGYQYDALGRLKRATGGQNIN